MKETNQKQTDQRRQGIPRKDTVKEKMMSAIQ